MSGRLIVLVLTTVAMSFHSSVHAQESDTGTLNKYVLRAVEQLSATKLGLGYASASFTEPQRLGTAVAIPASRPPLTMCVAAQMEVLLNALNIYMHETKDRKPEQFLPSKLWVKLYPKSIRGMIWMVRDSGSRGAAHALEYYGIGKQAAFTQLRPGAFVNFNRTNGTGHGVVFLSYLDRSGGELSSFSNEVAGFKYFSSQGTEASGGLGTRYAFFTDAGCPSIANGKRDCGVIRSTSQRLLNAGYLLAPANWSRLARDEAVKIASILPKGEGEFDASYFDGRTTDD